MSYIKQRKERNEKLLLYYSKVNTAKKAKQGFWISAAHFDIYEKTGEIKYLKSAKELFYISVNNIVSSFGLISGLYNFHKFHHLYDADMKKNIKVWIV